MIITIKNRKTKAASCLKYCDINSTNITFQQSDWSQACV